MNFLSVVGLILQLVFLYKCIDDVTSFVNTEFPYLFSEKLSIMRNKKLISVSSNEKNVKWIMRHMPTLYVADIIHFIITVVQSFT